MRGLKNKPNLDGPPETWVWFPDWASAFFAVAQCKGTIRDVPWLWSVCDDDGMGPLVNELAAVVRTAEANATRRFYADVRR